MARYGLRTVKYSRKMNAERELLSQEELWEAIQLLCNSKAEEFRMYGYENVTGEQIWACVSENYRHGWPRLNRLVNDIMSLKANRFMNWLMLSVYKDDVK
jgi:hypothetical protein